MEFLIQLDILHFEGLKSNKDTACELNTGGQTRLLLNRIS